MPWTCSSTAREFGDPIPEPRKRTPDADMITITDTNVEQAALAWLRGLGWRTTHGRMERSTLRRSHLGGSLVPMLVDEPSAPSAFGGIYDVPEAARYLRATSRWGEARPLNSASLIRWIRRGRAAPELAGVPGRKLLLGFEDLISMRVITALLASGVGWREIRKTERWLRETRGAPWPFAMEFLWTGQGDVFAEWAERLVSGSRNGQAALNLLWTYLIPVNDLAFSDESGLAISWEPFAGVVLEPQVQFGAPCVKGTRIPTRTVSGMIEAGDSPEWVAKAYEISIGEVQAAYDWESLLRAA